MTVLLIMAAVVAVALVGFSLTRRRDRDVAVLESGRGSRTDA